jgi:hypothetical protein
VNSQDSVQEKTATQLRGALSGLDADLARLDLELSQLQETRDRLAAERDQTRVMLAHVERGPE